MASVNTTSIREEITHVKQQLDEQVRSGKVADETRMLFSTLLMIVDMLVVIFLEKSTKKGNKNSSIPSSQTDEDKSAKPRKPNSKRDERDEPFANSRTEESVELSPVYRCECCGENLRDVQVDKHERRTRIDLVFEKRIEHTDAEIKTCPSCECVNKGAFAADLSGPQAVWTGRQGIRIEPAGGPDGFIQPRSDVVEEPDRTGHLSSHHAQVHPAVARSVGPLGRSGHQVAAGLASDER